MNQGEEDFERGCRADRLHRYRHAEAHFTRALAVYPQWHNALQRRALAREAQGKLSPAISDYRRALRTDPLCAWCWESLGDTCAKAGLYKDAQLCVRRALRLRPRDASLKHDLGNILLNLGLYREAIRSFQDLRRIKRFGMLWRQGRGRAFALLGSPLRALKDLDACVGMMPEAAETWFYRGLARLKARDLPGASKDLAKARRLGRTLPKAAQLTYKTLDLLLKQ